MTVGSPPALLRGAAAISARLGISARKAQALHQQGLLPTFRVGGTPYATVAALDDWLKLQRAGLLADMRRQRQTSTPPDKQFSQRLTGAVERSSTIIIGAIRESAPLRPMGFTPMTIGHIPAVMSMITLSRGDIVTVSKAPNDALTFWIRQGLIVPIEGGEGTGRNLRFKRYEAQIAALLVQGRRAGLNVDALRALSTATREGFEWIEENGATKQDYHFLLDEQFRSAWLERNQVSDERRAQINELVKAFRVISDDKRGTIVLSLLAEDWIIALHRRDDEIWYVEQIAEVEQLPGPFCIVFDLGQILAPLVWTKAVGSSNQEPSS